MFRILESHYFVWCTQFNHIPMEFDVEKYKDWPSLQVYRNSANIIKEYGSTLYVGIAGEEMAAIHLNCT